MKIEVGMYVRTNDGYIDKITRKDDFYDVGLKYLLNKLEIYVSDYEIKKASYDIMDLIKEDDVIKHPILGIRGITNINLERKEIGVDGLTWCINFENFKEAFELGTIQILTHEHFEKESYKIGE